MSESAAKSEPPFDPISQLVQISRHYGSDENFVLYGGGNTSYKTDDTLWVKGSGLSLADITNTGFIRLDRSTLCSIGNQTFSEVASERESQLMSEVKLAMLDAVESRPSVEALLHHCFPHKFVVHTHPTAVNALLCSCRSREFFDSCDDEVMFAEYVDPGYPLFQAVQKRFNERTAASRILPSALLLENHGVFVAGNSIDDIYQKYEFLHEMTGIDASEMAQLRAFEELKNAALNEFNSLVRARHGVSAYAFSSTFIRETLENAHAIPSPLTPDQIVYCGASYLFFDEFDEDVIMRSLDNELKENQLLPKILGVKGFGIIVLEPNQAFAKRCIEVFCDSILIAHFAEQFGGARFLSDSSVDYIVNWESEHYRKKKSEEKIS